MKKKISQLKVGTILSYLQMALNVIIGLIHSPIMIRALGQSEYGLYNTVSSTISMLTVVNLGFGAGYIRYYTKYNENNDTESIYKLNGLFLIVFTVLGLIALGGGLFLSSNLSMVFDEGLTALEYQTAKVLMLLLTINLTLSFPMNSFSCIITAHEKYVFLKLVGMIRTVISPLLTIPLLLCGYGSIMIVIVTLAFSVSVDIIYAIYVIFGLKQKFLFTHLEKGFFKSLFVYISFIAINMVVDQINLNIDKFLLGRYKGTVAVAVYSVGFTLYQYYMLFSSSIATLFTPRIHRIVEETNHDGILQRKKLTELFVKVGRIQFLILGLIATGLVFFGKPFIYFWAGSGYEDSYIVMLLLVLPSSIALIQNVGIEIQRAENKHRFRSIVYLIMALLNLIISIYLCQRYGAIGSAIGTAISFIIANGLIMNFYYHRKCNINIIVFWKNIFRVCLGLIIPLLAGIVIVKFINLYNIGYLIIAILVYTLIYVASMWGLGMNQEERQLIKRPILNMLKRLK